MKRSTIRLVVVLATLSIIGITVTQLFWVKRAFDFRENEFDQNVTDALTQVARSILKYNNHPAWSLDHPVQRVSNSYYAVMVNDVIPTGLLEPLLKNELEKRGIRLDFHYGVYDCSSRRMVYGDFVSLSGAHLREASPRPFPRFRQDNYFFGVCFSNRDAAILGQMGFWWFSSGVLLLVIAFFGYTLFVILKQKRLSEIQNDFINNMTHEFKTPIATIAISSGVLKNPNVAHTPGRLLNYASIISQEADRLQKGVERVLQMAVLEKDELKLKKETVHLHDLLTTVAEPFGVLLAEREGTLTFDLTARPDAVVADPLHLTNVVYNLLDNAVKYTCNRPDIRIATRNEKNGICLNVTDNGIGIAPEHQKRVFEKFYRVPTGNRHDVKGFGLGLHYVRSIVKAHCGRTALCSDPGRGSTFTVWLPI
ncbi:MAG TPA: HAMP domain-containing sensor histidine kinase [Cytophagales bacterium]